MTFQGQFASAIRFLEAAHIVEILREAGPAGLHVKDILRSVLDLRTNSKTATPADEVPVTAAHLSRQFPFLRLSRRVALS